MASSSQPQPQPRVTPRPKMYVAMPAFGGYVYNATVASLLRLHAACAERRIGINIDILPGESLVQRARNILTKKFMDSDCTHLMFIDADIGFEPDGVLRLLESGHEIATALYAKKVVNWDMVEQKLKDKSPEPVHQMGLEFNVNLFSSNTRVDKGFIRVLDAATGFMLISRDAMQRLYDAHASDLYCVNDLQCGTPIKDYIAVWDCMIDPVSKRYLSEDYSFNRRAQALGIETYSCLITPLTHVGHDLYEGKFAARGHDHDPPPQPALTKDATDAVLVAVIGDTNQTSWGALWGLMCLQHAMNAARIKTHVTFFTDVNSAMNVCYKRGYHTLMIQHARALIDVRFFVEALQAAKDVVVAVAPVPGIDWTRVADGASTEAAKTRGLRYNVDTLIGDGRYRVAVGLRSMPLAVIRRGVLETVAPKVAHSGGYLFWAEDVFRGAHRSHVKRFLALADADALADTAYDASVYGPMEFTGVVGLRATAVR